MHNGHAKGKSYYGRCAYQGQYSFNATQAAYDFFTTRQGQNETDEDYLSHFNCRLWNLELARGDTSCAVPNYWVNRFILY